MSGNGSLNCLFLPNCTFCATFRLIFFDSFIVDHIKGQFWTRLCKAFYAYNLCLWSCLAGDRFCLVSYLSLKWSVKILAVLKTFFSFRTSFSIFLHFTWSLLFFWSPTFYSWLSTWVYQNEFCACFEHNLKAIQPFILKLLLFFRFSTDWLFFSFTTLNYLKWKKCLSLLFLMIFEV